MPKHPTLVAEPMGQRLQTHPRSNDARNLRGNVGRNGQQPAALPVIEAEGPCPQVVADSQRQHIFELEQRSDDAAEAPLLKDLTDFLLNEADFVGHIWKKISHSAGELGIDGRGLKHGGFSFSGMTRAASLPEPQNHEMLATWREKVNE
jgi:hypothetical protein